MSDYHLSCLIVEFEFPGTKLVSCFTAFSYLSVILHQYSCVVPLILLQVPCVCYADLRIPICELCLSEMKLNNLFRFWWFLLQWPVNCMGVDIRPNKDFQSVYMLGMQVRIIQLMKLGYTTPSTSCCYPTARHPGPAQPLRHRWASVLPELLGVRLLPLPLPPLTTHLGIHRHRVGPTTGPAARLAVNSPTPPP
jgi:hypothetical protein